MADHQIVDCATGQVTTREYTADERADHERIVAARLAELDEQRQREADLATVRRRAASDEGFASLARLLGLTD